MIAIGRSARPFAGDSKANGKTRCHDGDCSGRHRDRGGDQDPIFASGWRSCANRGSYRAWAPSWSATTRARGWYVNGKHRDCAEVGIASIRRDLPATATQEEVEQAVAELNDDPACTGYIVQLPLPKGRDEQRVLELIDPAKDADGLHPINLGRLVLGATAPLPCTPRGIVELLRRYDVPLDGAEVVVIGRGVTVGRPLGLLLTRALGERHGHHSATPAPGTSPRTPATRTSSWPRPASRA